MNKKELNKILDDHKLWLESKGEKGTQANLKGANLQGACLKGAYLKGANLNVANLNGANLERANLGGSNLGGSNLEGANLIGAYMLGANLKGSKFTYEIREATILSYCKITKDQLPWLALHPRFSEIYPTLTVLE